MGIPQTLTNFNNSLLQCDSLIAKAHSPSSLSALDKEQITTAAFLNMFIAWESFIEECFSSYLLGEQTISGISPVKFVNPRDEVHAKQIIVANNRFFDYANHEYVVKLSNLFFDTGGPIARELQLIQSELSDLKTMRNASAHITSSTQRALEAVALKLLGTPSLNIKLYDLIVHPLPPRSTNHGSTVFEHFKNLLKLTASRIAA